MPDGHSHKQPNSRLCFVCGLQNPFGLRLEFYDNGVDEVLCTYAIADNYQGYPGIAHGGIVAAILDEVVGRVAMIDNHMRFFVTAKMEIKYRNPVPLNTTLTITGTPVRHRGRLLQARGEIRLADGGLLVEATMTLVDVPEELRVTEDVRELLGWKVY